MFDGVGSAQLAIAAAIGLIGLSTCLAWIPATKRDPTGLATRVFVTVGLGAAVLDPLGVGTVLGLSLAAMGGLVWWEGRPEPEVPRPRRRGYYVGAVLAAVVTYATFRGWGPLDRIPEDGRPFVALFVGVIAVLGTLAVADRSRITFRDKLRRRFQVPTPRPGIQVVPIDRPPETSVTLERVDDDMPGEGSGYAPDADHGLAALLPSAGRPPAAADTAPDPYASADDPPAPPTALPEQAESDHDQPADTRAEA